MQKPRLLFFVGTGVVTSLLLIIATQQLKGTATFDPKDFEERWAKTVTPGLEANHSPRLGTAHSSAKIKLVEFSDFQCPFCARQARELTRILRNYGDAVELVFKNFPLDMSCNPLMKFPMHDSACLAARAAWCSHQHQVFEEFGALMFANQRNLGFEQIVAWAGELKLNRNAFEKCLSSPEARAAVSADIKAAQIANIQGTPTFFINGRRFEGLVTMELIEWLLKNPQKL